MRPVDRVMMLLATASALPLGAAELNVLLTPKSGITVGNPVRVVVEARLEPDQSVIPPNWTEHWLPEEQEDVELVLVGDPITETRGDSTVWRQILTLRGFRPGPVELPAPAIDLRARGNKTIRLESDAPLRWTVESVLPSNGEVEVRPPSPVQPLPLGSSFWTLTAFLAVATAATSWTASRAGAFAAQRPRASDQEPLTELRLALKALDPRNPVRGHVGLSASLRRFLERRAGTPALERTTTEIYRDLTEIAVDDSSRHQVRQILLNCDRVKFGGFPATREELTQRVRRTQSVAEQIETHLLAAEAEAATVREIEGGA